MGASWPRWMTLCAMLCGAIGALRRQIVEHDHARLMTGEIVLQGKDLPAVAQRALGRQSPLASDAGVRSQPRSSLQEVEAVAGPAGPADGVQTGNITARAGVVARSNRTSGSSDFLWLVGSRDLSGRDARRAAQVIFAPGKTFQPSSCSPRNR